MRFSTLTLFGIVSAASISSALSQLQFETGCLVLLGIVVASIFTIPKLAWRYCIYGGIGGVATGIVLMLLYMLISEGRISARSRSESGPLIDIIYNWRPWIMFCGSLIGGTTGLFLYQNRTRINSEHESADNRTENDS